MRRICDATIDGMAICGALLSEVFVVMVPLVLIYDGIRWLLRMPLAIALLALSVGSVAIAVEPPKSTDQQLARIEAGLRTLLERSAATDAAVTAIGGKVDALTARVTALEAAGKSHHDVATKTLDNTEREKEFWGRLLKASAANVRRTEREACEAESYANWLRYRPPCRVVVPVCRPVHYHCQPVYPVHCWR